MREIIMENVKCGVCGIRENVEFWEGLSREDVEYQKRNHICWDCQDKEDERIAHISNCEW